MNAAPALVNPSAADAFRRFTHSWKSAALAVVIGLALLFGLPSVIDDFLLIQVTIYLIMSILAVSLGFIWGYGGILCFGQAAFFGLGAYTYAVAVVNIGDSSVPLLLSIVVPALFAALLGYVIFYGRLSDVYMGVITLTVTLILFNLINSTAGPEWRIGSAALGGFNGMPAIPPLNAPGNVEEAITPRGLFNLSFGLLIVIYVGLRFLIVSKVGRVIIASRENENRVLLLGYDARVYKLFTFVLGGAIAGLAGCLFANWGAFTSPTIFGLAQSAQIIIWVIVGGLGTLLGPIFGCIVIQWLSTEVGTQQVLNANLMLGGVMLIFVLLVPKGIVPSIGLVVERLLRRKSVAQTSDPLSVGHKPAGGALGSEGRGMTPLIETRDLNVRFGGVHATKDVNFKLGENELRCVIGPNGAGKSTFFKLLTGQVKPTSGHILFRGKDISDMQPHDPGRLGIGIKTQVPSLFNGLTVWENVWLSARRIHTATQAQRITGETLERVGMTAYRDRVVGLLAHGLRQWVEIGLVIAPDPPLILLDEPAAGMSDAEVERTAALILELNKRHALVVVEHDMNFIRAIAKTVTVLHQGAIIREDTPDRIMSDPMIQQIYLGKKPQ